MENPFEKFNTVPPVAEQEPSAQSEQTQTTPTDNTPVEPTTPTPDQPQANTTQVDPFFEQFNKRYNTQYKTDDELKPLFELPKKVTEYETKLKDKEQLEKSVEQYKRELEIARQSEASKYLSDPLMQKAWVANQLQKKYPDKDPFILQEIAMSDVSKMDAIEAIAKEKKINFPSYNIEDIKAVIMNDLGIDPALKPEEWDSLTRTKVGMKGEEAKANIKRLTEGIELPKVETQEDYKKRVEDELAKRSATVAPLKEKFLQFDKFKVRDDLEYTVPEEFKAKSNSIFDTYMVQFGVEPTPENVEILEAIQRATFFDEYKDKIYEVMYKDAETKQKKQLDIELGNATPPNTATASDGARQGNLQDGSAFLKNVRGGSNVKQI